MHLRFRFLFSLFLVFCFGLSIAQTFTDSNLPIVVITTDGFQAIPDEPKVYGTMRIIDNGWGKRNALTDIAKPEALDYDGRIGIEIRGSSSQYLQKKQYSLVTINTDKSNRNVSLLGMPSEHDWVLNGFAFDPSLMRDHISYLLSNTIGEYAPRTRYCEVVINNNYMGLYVLQEKIKIDDNRVDITEMDNKDNDLPALSGGYIVKADKVAGQDVPAWTMKSYSNADVNFILEDPKPSDLTTAQRQYVQNVFLQFSAAAGNGNTSVINGYPSFIDIPSFIDYMLIAELASNADSYQFSTFFHKDRNGKLRAGPLWDFNLTYGNDLFLWNFNRSFFNIWQFNNGDNIGARFWRDLFTNPTFNCYFSKRFHELEAPGQPFHLTSLSTMIDTTAMLISEAAGRDLAQWQAEKAAWYTPSDLPSQVNMIKNFLKNRLEWMSSQLGSYAACENIPAPPLVITRIHYRPATTAVFTESDNLEFIEITNNSDKMVDLSGVYFAGTGLVYQFSAGAQLDPNAVIQLASSRKTFAARYQYNAYDSYTRHLDNDGETIRLVDAFGNVIDEVSYSNLPPWPNADGNGFHLKLKDVNLDNAVASNWEASDEEPMSLVTSVKHIMSLSVEVSPNPVATFLTVTSPTPIDRIMIHNAMGLQVTMVKPGPFETVSVDVRDYPTGLYIVSITSGKEVIQRKILKY